MHKAWKKKLELEEGTVEGELSEERGEWWRQFGKVIRACVR